MGTKPAVGNGVPVEDAEGFAEVLAWLPEGWEAQLRETGAFVRARRVHTPGDLLRLVLAYAVLRLSLPALARWADQQGIARLAFPSLWERLADCLPFLRWAVGRMVQQAWAGLPAGPIWCPIDATTFTLPGSTKRDWLAHVAFSDGGPVGVRVVKAGGPGSGESLRHWDTLPEGVVVLGDRAYGTPPGLAAMDAAARPFVVRFTWNNLPLYDGATDGGRIAPRRALSGLAPGAVREFGAWIRPHAGEPFRARVVVVAKTAEQAERARRMARRESLRKGHTPDATSLFVAGYVTLVSNLPAGAADAPLVAEAYRWRWQIEREFRRFKGTTQLRRLPNQRDDTVEFYLLATLLAWLLAHRIARQSAFFPWGCPLAGARPAGPDQPGRPAARRV